MTKASAITLKPLAVDMQVEINDTCMCPGCEETFVFSGWAVAHWHEGFIYTCQYCKTRIGFDSGEVYSVTIGSGGKQ